MIDNAAFYDEVLGRIADDYEAPQTIAADLARDLGREVTEHEVLVALLALVTSVQVQAFVYDAAGQDYMPVAVSDVVSRGTLWFTTKK